MKHKLSDIEELIREGKKIQAIKLWREHTGNSLKESKDIIDNFEQNGIWIDVDELPKPVQEPSPIQLTPNSTADLESTTVSNPSESSTIKNSCAALIAEGNKIQAIKQWREQMGTSLKESKMQIEHFERTGTWHPTSPIIPSENTPALESDSDIDDVVHSTESVERQGFGFGYWLVVLILLGFLASQFLS